MDPDPRIRLELESPLLLLVTCNGSNGLRSHLTPDHHPQGQRDTERREHCLVQLKSKKDQVRGE